MNCRKLICYAAITMPFFLAASRPALAQLPKANAADETALMERAAAFVDAFEKGDAKAVAAFWTPDGDYTDRDGRCLKGRDAIEKAFAEFFAENKGMKVRIDVSSLRLVTPDVAIEDGTTAVIPPNGGPPSRARYTVVHVKKDGKWYLSSVRDSVYVPDTNYPKLRGLDWIIGNWANETPGGESSTVTFEWAMNQNFIASSYATKFRNMTLAGGNQWIGWDPLNNRIRSWAFDFEGGYGEGFWTVDGNKLIIKNTSVTREGKKLAATNTVTRIDADTVSWQSSERTEDGKPLPDIKEIKMKRQPE